MVRLTERFRRSNYPGLNDAEDNLVRKYIDQEDPDIEALETNIPLGPGEILEDFVNDALRKSWANTSQFKLDLLIEEPGQVLAIELKDHVRTSALGQALSYRYWLERQRDFGKPIVPQTAAEVVNPSAVGPHKAHNVEIVPLTDRARDMVEQGERAITEGNTITLDN